MSAIENEFDTPDVREFSLLEKACLLPSKSFSWWLLVICSTVCISLALFHVFVAAFGTPETRSFRSTHLTGMVLIAFLMKPLFRQTIAEAIFQGNKAQDFKRLLGFFIDFLFVSIAVALQFYTLVDLDTFMGREGNLNTMDVVAGTSMILLVLEGTRRTVGLPMVLVTLFFIIHTLFANYFGSFLFGPPTSYTKYVDIIFMRADGIFGIPILVASTYIVLFIIFGAILVRSGAGRFFMDLAIALTGHKVGGPAKAAVVSSSFLGTVSGSAVANVVTTGSFTIPLMKKTGLSPRFAAAVEACASSGGQITPPIMGAAAFVIAEFLHVSYFTVLIAAIVPTFLYYATVYFQVDLEARKSGVTTIPKDKLPRVGYVLKQGWHQLLTLIVLVALLSVGFTPMLSAFWAIIALCCLSFVRANTRLSPVDLLAALETGVRNAMPVSMACACAGIIIGSIFVSGLGLKFTQSVIFMSHGILFVLLMLTAVAAIVLGMGMTTTAVYITVAALIAPALVAMDVVPIAAHLFAFYFGVVSNITPPVALASFAAAGISGSSPMATAWTSSRIGIATYIVPFVFVYNPTLLFEGPLWMSLISILATLIGLWGVSIALAGWYKTVMTGLERGALVAVSIMLFIAPMSSLQIPGLMAISGYVFWIVGLCGVLAIVSRHHTEHKRTLV